MAIAVEREANDICGVLLPAGVQGTGHGAPDLRKSLLDHSTVGAHTDPLAELRGHMNHDTLALRTHAPVFPLGPPALQLGLERSQLEEGGLFIQQGVFLQRHTQRKTRDIHLETVGDLNTQAGETMALLCTQVHANKQSNDPIMNRFIKCEPY